MDKNTLSLLLENHVDGVDRSSILVAHWWYAGNKVRSGIFCKNISKGGEDGR